MVDAVKTTRWSRFCAKPHGFAIKSAVCRFASLCKLSVVEAAGHDLEFDYHACTYKGVRLQCCSYLPGHSDLHFCMQVEKNVLMYNIMVLVYQEDTVVVLTTLFTDRLVHEYTLMLACMQLRGD